jgi:hypothetical protein
MSTIKEKKKVNILPSSKENQKKANKPDENDLSQKGQCGENL